MTVGQPIEDRRLQLPVDNVFRFCANDGMPLIPKDARGTVKMVPAAEIEAARRQGRHS